MTDYNKSEFYFETGSYEGNEEKVLDIKNRNRSENATREHLSWRYRGQKSKKPPIIFFIKTESQKIVGMASLIYRAYSVSGQSVEIPILGDISLDEDLRGKGIAKRLFIYINSYLRKDKALFAFVLPNIAAKKSLIKSGWKSEQDLIRYVFFLNPKGALKKIQNKTIISLVSYLFSYPVRSFLFISRHKEIEMRTTNRFSDKFDKFWMQLRNDTLITKDRTAEYLKWRYSQHPFNSFQVYEFYMHKDFIGYIVAKYSKEENALSIYELFAKNERDLTSIIRHFIYKCTCMEKVHSVRITLNQKNPYEKILKKNFFIKRPTDNVFQTYDLRTEISESNWLITTGDKDV